MTPGSPEWVKLITASKVAAILGVSPWESPRSVWHLMHGDLPREESTEQQRRGHYLEPAILAWWRDQHGVIDGEWADQPEYRLDGWAAATPDMVACHPVHDNVLVEAKSTADDGDWGQPGTDEIPDYYLVQVYWQMHVSGIHRCYVPVIGPRLRFVEYVVDYDQRYGQALERTMRKFYDSLAADEPPPLDDTVATYNAVRKVHPDIDNGVSVQIDEATAAEYVEALNALAAAEPGDRLARSTMTDLMGRAQYAECNGVRIARRQSNGEGKGVSVRQVAKDTSAFTTRENVA
jgi:putative phage-type endonuclease